MSDEKPPPWNVDTDNSCGFNTVGPNGSFVLVPANLAPLLANPGSIGQTHLLLDGSPARDTALLEPCGKKDQRFLNRPKPAVFFSFLADCKEP